MKRKYPHLFDEIRELITTQVTLSVREAILKVFRSIKTILLELFDERFVVVLVGTTTSTTIAITTA